jgi:small-conductance mechanosensitive channel
MLEKFKNGTFTEPASPTGAAAPGMSTVSYWIDPASPVGAVVCALVFGLIAWIVGRALRLAIHRILSYDTRALVDRTTVQFLGQLAQIGVYLFAFISYAHLVPALAHLGTAWLAGVSVISVIIGLAAQNTLGNLIAGVSLVLYRPFKIGDRLQVAAPTGLETGIVESVNLGYTVLKTDDNRRIVVPNSLIASQMIVNLTGDDPRVLCSVPVSLHYEADVDKARSILMAAARQNPKAKSVSGCPVTQVGPAGVVLTLSAWCANTDDAFDLKCALLEEARRQFIQAGIVPPFPQQIVSLCQGRPPA